MSELEIDLGAIAANTRRFANATDGALVAVVKADGFGAGMWEVATTALAHGASSLGVTSLGEAHQLRSRGIGGRVMSWLNPVDADWGWAMHAHVDVVIPSLDHLDAVVRVSRALGVRARVHLHADCGLARDGAPAAVWPRLCAAARLAERAGRVRVVGLMGHLSHADRPEDPHNGRERQRFSEAVSAARRAGLDTRLLHLAASAATLHDPAARLSCSRVGAGLVGIDPAGIASLDQPFTLRSRLVSTHRAAAGTGVGYGSTWSAPSDTVLGLIPLGYADGLPRAASNRAEVVVGGRRCPVVGRISMDQTVVDLGPAGAPLGATVTVFGPTSTGAPSVADWARWCETIPHEIVTGIGPRVTRVVHPVVDERVGERVDQWVDQPVAERRDVVGS